MRAPCGFSDIPEECFIYKMEIAAWVTQEE